MNNKIADLFFNLALASWLRKNINIWINDKIDDEIYFKIEYEINYRR